MEKIVVKLGQDTPMWHFQGAFDDCCLRATEVKPKLDRFLLAKLDTGELSVNECALTSRDDVPSTWWANEDKTAFNYKMRISAESRRIIDSQVPDVDRNGNPRFKNLYPVYFARVGENKSKDMELVMMECIRVKLMVYDDDLAKCIKNNISAFFASHSFGARQDKGFGCFRVIKNSNETTPTMGVLSGASYYFVVPGPSTNDSKKKQEEQEKKEAEKKRFKSLFDHINYFHKVIRSGVNERGCYVKSMMYHYAKSKEDVWDKPVIRTKFNFTNNVYKSICGKMDSRRPVRPQLSEEYNQCKDLIGKKNLYRDALGLSTSQDWISYGNKVKTSLHGNESEEVRFKSPVDYRPVPTTDGGFIVYIIIHELPNELRQASFDISCDKSRERLEGMKISDAISISDYFEFIYDNTWRVYLDEVEETDCLDIQPGRERSEPYTFITQVFDTLNIVAR